MRRPILVSPSLYRAAIKFLMGLGTNPELTANDQRKLRSYLRGPFANGMTEEQAGAILSDEGLNWKRGQ